jgi:hypothetical protein
MLHAFSRSRHQENRLPVTDMMFLSSASPHPFPGKGNFFPFSLLLIFLFHSLLLSSLFDVLVMNFTSRTKKGEQG